MLDNNKHSPPFIHKLGPRHTTLTLNVKKRPKTKNNSFAGIKTSIFRGRS